MTGLMEADGSHARFGPDSLGTGTHAGIGEGHRSGAPKSESGMLLTTVAVREQIRAEDVWARYDSLSGAGLGLNWPCLLVPGRFDAEESLVEIDVAPLKRLKLPQSESAVHGSCPHGTICDRQSIDEPLRFVGARNTVAGSFNGWEGQAVCTVTIRVRTSPLLPAIRPVMRVTPNATPFPRSRTSSTWMRDSS